MSYTEPAALYFFAAGPVVPAPTLVSVSLLFQHLSPLVPGAAFGTGVGPLTGASLYIEITRVRRYLRDVVRILHPAPSCSAYSAILPNPLSVYLVGDCRPLK